MKDSKGRPTRYALTVKKWSFSSATECFELCIDTQSDTAFYLGECYRNGTGKKKDYKQAFEFYLKSAE